MATVTVYFLNTTASAPNWFGRVQDNGSAPAGALSAFGWTVGKVAVTTPYWRGFLGATARSTAAQAASYIDTAVRPAQGTGSGATTASDSFRSDNPLNGTFAAGNWNFTFGMRTGAATTVGRIRLNVWASANADGTGTVRKLNSATLVGSTVTMSLATTTYNSTVTWAAPQVVLANEYLFTQIEWQETTAGTSNSCTAQFYQASFVTSDYVYAPATGTLVETQGNQSIAATGGPVVDGDLVEPQAAQSIAAASDVAIGGTLSLTAASDTLSAAGDVAASGISGTLNVSQASETLSAAGTVSVGATFGVNQAAQTLVAGGGATVSGQLGVSQANNTVVAAGGPVARGTLAAPQAAQTIAAGGAVVIGGTLGLPQAAQTLSAAGGPIVRGTLSVPQAAQTISATASVITGISGALNVAQAGQTLSAAGFTAVGATLSVIQAAQTLQAAATAEFIAVLAALNVTQDSETLFAAASALIPLPTPAKRSFKIATEKRTATVPAAARFGSAKRTTASASTKADQRMARVAPAANVSGKVPKDQRSASVS